ncbi:unnamed protein product [Dovyalis caffra]|uniref:Uncharacterized protein n=1 Tax=Dovyalis caffra TaxID=77055 RepID=A0AAV1R8C9_9ROSI|nr:unnamed protein product [Dovyalis caffra]
MMCSQLYLCRVGRPVGQEKSEISHQEFEVLPLNFPKQQATGQVASAQGQSGDYESVAEPYRSETAIEEHFRPQKDLASNAFTMWHTLSELLHPENTVAESIHVIKLRSSVQEISSMCKDL